MAASEFFPIGPDTRIARGRALLESGLDDELFALDVDRGSCFSFNATAHAVWAMIETPTRFDALCAALAERYAVDAATCRADVAALLHELALDDLVIFDPQ